MYSLLQFLYLYLYAIKIVLDAVDYIKVYILY